MDWVNIVAFIGLFVGFGGIAVAAWKGKLFKVLMVIAFTLPCMGQSNCDKIVADTAGMLGGKVAQVEQAAGPLINQGADVHVITLVSSGGNLDTTEDRLEKQCPSWHNAQGVRKSTLLVLAVTKDRKLGAYYGSAWHSALDNHWNRIKSDYMVPYFKDGDYAGGFIAAEQQLAKRLMAAKDESLKPAVSQTINQATDFSGLWTFFKWLFWAGLLGGLIWLIYWSVNKHKEDQERVAKAQQDAQIARNLAANDVKTLEDSIESRKSIGEQVPRYADDLLDTASQSYSRLSSTISTSPDTDGLAVSAYELMEQQYTAISKLVSQARQVVFTGKIKKENDDAEPSKPSAVSYSSHRGKNSVPSQPSTNSQPSQAKNVEPTPPPQPTYVPSSNNVVIVNNETESYPRHERYREEPSSSYGDSGGGGSSSWSSSSSGDSDSGGGGSSSWSSSDSSSDSGGSSDFGSSDSGGGGSSDF